jgi:hypothetical protein
MSDDPNRGMRLLGLLIAVGVSTALWALIFLALMWLL